MSRVPGDGVQKCCPPRRWSQRFSRETFFEMDRHFSMKECVDAAKIVRGCEHSGQSPNSLFESILGGP
jgi:hypothetical protein